MDGPRLGIDVPAAARAQARVEALAAEAAAVAVGASSVARRVRDRRRPTAALAVAERDFPGSGRRYVAWLRAGQFAVAERAAVRLAGGFLPAPRGAWTSGSSVRPFVAGAPAEPAPGLTASPVAQEALDWRFRVRFVQPQEWVRLTLESAAFDRLDAFVFRNGVPVRQVTAGDAESRTVVLRDLPASNEFSLRTLWPVCARCYQGLDDLRVRIDVGPDAR